MSNPHPSLPGRHGILVSVAVALLASACASGPYKTNLKLVGTDTLNPTFDQTYTSVNVRVFPLFDRAAFDNATDEELLSSPPTLQQAAWSPPFTPTVVYVDQVNDLEIEIRPGVKYLGIIGLFNEVKGPYKDVIAVDAIDESEVVLDDFTLAIRPVEED